MLIIIRNKPALDSIADGFPSLVVLIINVASLYAGMLIDHEHGSRIERQLLPTRLVFVQQTAKGIAQPVGRLIPTVGQQRMKCDVKPTVTEGLYAACDIHIGQRRPMSKPASPRRISFAESSQIQCGPLKLFH